MEYVRLSGIAPPDVISVGVRTMLKNDTGPLARRNGVYKQVNRGRDYRLSATLNGPFLAMRGKP